MCIPTHPIKKKTGAGSAGAMGSLVVPPTSSLACAAVPVVVVPVPVSALRKSTTTTTATSKRLRRVRFEQDESDSSEGEISSPPSPLNQLSDWSGVWYAPEDLLGFRDEARKHCRALRESLITAAAAASNNTTSDEEYSSDSSSSSSSSSSSLSSSSSTATSEPFTLSSCGGDDECRGLEARCCLERQRRKYLTNRCIVRAQLQLSQSQLAVLAQKCTSWASVLAAQEGARDFHRAYGGESASRKRTAAATATAPTFEEVRRVRSRTV